LKNAYIIKGESVVKDSEGNIIEIHVTYDTDSLSGSGSEASQRKVSGTLHWVSIAHAIPAEMRLYDRLFSDEAPDSHKDKDFLEFVNPDSLKVVSGFVEPSLSDVKNEDKFQFQRLGYFTVDKDSTASKLVFNKTVGLKDAWAEQGTTDKKALEKIEREIGSFFKLDDEKRVLAQNNFETALAAINNYSLLKTEFTKVSKNDKNALLYKNLILRYSKIVPSDFEKEVLHKLYAMSLKSESHFVRLEALLHLKNDEASSKFLETEIQDLKKIEKSESILGFLNQL